MSMWGKVRPRWQSGNSMVYLETGEERTVRVQMLRRAGRGVILTQRDDSWDRSGVGLAEAFSICDTHTPTAPTKLQAFSRFFIPGTVEQFPSSKLFKSLCYFPLWLKIHDGR